MKVKEITLSECCNGDILASDVLNSSGVMLIAKDTVMNEYIKGHLINLGIANVRVYSHLNEFKNSSVPYREFRKNYKDIVLETKNILHDIATGRPLDYQKVSCISDQIYKNINQNNNIIRCLVEIRSADEYTYTHCVNTAFYSMLIGKWLKLSGLEINRAIQSGLLHDIGKSKIPNGILNKKGMLTIEEYEVIKKHTTLGYEMIEDIDEIDVDIKRAVLLHHERIDGSGYPFNAIPDNINLYSKIVAVADVYDAMVSDRVYKKRATPFDAFAMFLTVGISAFDTTILKAFLNNLVNYYVGINVMLSNGEIGEIVYIPPHDLVKPVVKVSFGYIDLSKQSDLRILDMV